MKKVLLTGMLAIGLFACQNSSKPEDQATQPAETKEAAHDHEEHTDGPSAVQLNNGEKWVANPETTTAIRNMAALVKDFPESPVLEDYHNLAAKLEAEFAMLVEKCTMTGDAHEQLHNYILPLRDMFPGLKSDDLDTCRSTLKELTRHLSEYERYFV